MLQKLRPMLASASVGLAVALVLGRLSGLVRELVIATRFGVSLEADLAIILLTIPDLLVNLLLAGGLSAALVPKLRALSVDDGEALFRATAAIATAVFGLLGLSIALYPQGLFAIFAPGLIDETSIIRFSALMLLAVSIPLTATSGVTSAYLNSRDRFFVPGLGTLIFNICVVVMLLIPEPGNSLKMLAIGIFGGAAARLASQALLLPSRLFRSSQTMLFDKGFAVAFGAGILASGLTLIPTTLIRSAASLLDDGNVALFNYAQKLVELPVGILITALSIVVLSKLAALYADGKLEQAERDLRSALRLALLMASLIAIFGEAAAQSLARVVFLRGAMEETEVRAVGAIFQVLLTGVPFVAISTLASASLNARLRTVEVLHVTAWSIIALFFFAVPGFLERSIQLLAAAIVASQGVLALLLARRAGVRFWGTEGVINKSLLGPLAISFALALACALGAHWLQDISDLLSVAVCAIGFVSSLALAVGMMHDRSD